MSHVVELEDGRSITVDANSIELEKGFYVLKRDNEIVARYLASKVIGWRKLEVQSVSSSF